MRHFFVDVAAIQEKDILLTGSNFNHIKNVLRMKAGDVISVSNGIDNREYRCHIESFGENEIYCRLDFIKEADVELPVRVTLFQGLPKGDKMDFIIEKSVELGVSEIVPVACSRSVVRPDPKKAKNRVDRWRKKAEAAAKQSRRAILPEVHEICDFEEAVRLSSALDSSLIPYELSRGFEETRRRIEGLQAGHSLGIFIGPEGGFSEEEIAMAQEMGIDSVTLGKRILRTETAALVVLSWLIYQFETD